MHTNLDAPCESCVTVYPRDPNDAKHDTLTECSLTSSYGKDNVKANCNEKGHVSWTVHVTEGYKLDPILGHFGIRLADKDMPKRIGFIVMVEDPKNEAQTNDIRQFLESKSSQKISSFGGRRGIRGWGGVELDAAEKVEVRAYKGVKAVFYAPEATLH